MNLLKDHKIQLYYVFVCRQVIYLGTLETHI